MTRGASAHNAGAAAVPIIEEAAFRNSSPMNPNQLSRMRYLLLLNVICWIIVLLVSTPSVLSTVIDPSTTLECHRREYTHNVFRTDSLGRKCWDRVTVMSCWGRCDSNEIADWQFPFKVSHHPVCIHDERVLRQIELRNCEADVELGTSIYEYYEAITCACRVCQSSAASCEGLPHQERNLV